MRERVTEQGIPSWFLMAEAFSRWTAGGEMTVKAMVIAESNIPVQVYLAPLK